ncbi:MAG: efflux RND transporter periplasmic adaptor subunit [Verrucomicrobia bacterium]|nr:efflux RND transporter periplasmic adaptor subunit [Verrucomicrobiota bacterium]
MSDPRKPRWIKRTVKLVITLVVLAALGWGGRWGWQKLSPGLFGSRRVEKMPTSKTRIASISEEIIAVGRVRAVFSTELRSEINGRIVKIVAVDGQAVKKDDEILRLDQTDILTQLQEAERSIEAAKLRAERAKADFARQKALRDSGLITAKDFDEARITFSLAENDNRIFEARAANLRDKLTKTIIRAPHNGTLLLRDLTEGQVITGAAAQNGGMLLGEVADLSVLMVRTNINEIDVARLKVSDAARVRVDSIRSMIVNGTIKRISTSATDSSVDRTRIFPVDVVLENATDRIRPGMSATVFVTLAHVENALTLPLAGVFSTAEAVRYVFVAKGERFEVREIEAGIADNRRVQVLSGLEDNEEVALTRPLEFDGEIPAGAQPVVPTKPKGAAGGPSLGPPGGGRSRGRGN